MVIAFVCMPVHTKCLINRMGDLFFFCLFTLSVLSSLSVSSPIVDIYDISKTVFLTVITGKSLDEDLPLLLVSVNYVSQSFPFVLKRSYRLSAFTV